MVPKVKKPPKPRKRERGIGLRHKPTVLVRLTLDLPAELLAELESLRLAVRPTKRQSKQAFIRSILAAHALAAAVKVPNAQ